jgi:hypothetical protein
MESVLVGFQDLSTAKCVFFGLFLDGNNSFIRSQISVILLSFGEQ